MLWSPSQRINPRIVGKGQKLPRLLESVFWGHSCVFSQQGGSGGTKNAVPGNLRRPRRGHHRQPGEETADDIADQGHWELSRGVNKQSRQVATRKLPWATTSWNPPPSTPRPKTIGRPHATIFPLLWLKTKNYSLFLRNKLKGFVKLIDIYFVSGGVSIRPRTTENLPCSIQWAVKSEHRVPHPFAGKPR